MIATEKLNLDAVDVKNKKAAPAKSKGKTVSRYSVFAQHDGVKALLRDNGVQAKLRLGAPDDKFEQEADRVAEKLVNEPPQQQTPLPKTGAPEMPPTIVQRVCEQCEDELRQQPEDERDEEEDLLQAAPLPGRTATLDHQLSLAIRAMRRGGRTLPQREYFQSHMGYDFSATRIHTDSRAHHLAAQVGARAFTFGEHIVFGSGEFAPHTTGGRKLLAHELTHVVQQTRPSLLADTSPLVHATAGIGLRVQRNETGDEYPLPELDDEHMPDDSGVPDEETVTEGIEWPRAQALNLDWWQRLSLNEVLPIHDYDPVHQPRTWANKVYAAQEILREAGITRVEDRPFEIDGVLGPRTTLALRQVAQDEQHPARERLQTLGFDLDAIAVAEAAELHALAEIRRPSFILEWNFRPLGERVIRYYDATYEMVIRDREVIDALLFGGDVPEDIRREDRIELLRRLYGREGNRLQGRIAFIQVERPFVHSRLDSQRAASRDRRSTDFAAMLHFEALTITMAGTLLDLFEQRDAFIEAVDRADEETQEAFVEGINLLAPPEQSEASPEQRAALIFLTYLPVLPPEERQPVVSSYLTERQQRREAQEEARQAHNREAARQRAENLIRMMDDEETYVVTRQVNFETYLRRQLPDARHFDLVIDELTSRQPDQFMRLFDVLDDLDSEIGQATLVELSLAGRYVDHPRVQALMRDLNARREEVFEHTFVAGDDPHIMLDGDQRLGIDDVAGDISSVYYRDEFGEQLKPESSERLRVEMERQSRLYFDNLAAGREEERSTDDIGLELLQRSWAALGMSEDRDLEDVEIRESYMLKGVRPAADRGDGIRRWEVEYVKVRRMITDTEDTGWVEDLTTQAWRDDSQFSNDLFWLAYSQQADVIRTAAMVVAVGTLIVVAWEAGAIAALVRAGGGALQVLASIAISEAIYLLTHERWTLRGILVAGIEGYLAALAFKRFAPVGAAVAGRLSGETFRQLVVRWLVRHGTTGALSGATTLPAGKFADDLLRIAQNGGGRFSGLDQYLAAAAIGLLIGAVAEIGGSALLAPIFRTADTTALNSLDEVVGRASSRGVTPTQWTAELVGALSGMRRWARGVMDDVIADGMMPTLRQRVTQAIQHYRTGWRITILRQLVDMANQPLSRDAVRGMEVLLRSTQGHLDNDAMAVLLRHVSRDPTRIPGWFNFIGGLDDEVARAMATGGQLRDLADAPASLILGGRRGPAEVAGLLGQRFNDSVTDLESFATRLNALDDAVADDVLAFMRARGTAVTPESLLRIAGASGLGDDSVAGLVRLMGQGDRARVEALLNALPDDEVGTYLNRMRTAPHDELEMVARLLDDIGPDDVAWAASLPTADANSLLRGLSADARTAIVDISAQQAHSLRNLVGLNILDDALSNGAAHNVRGSHLQMLRNHFSDVTVRDFVTWASETARRMQRLKLVADNVETAATRLAAGGRLQADTLVLDSNVIFAMERLMRGTRFAALSENLQDAINGIRSERGLSHYSDPPVGTLPDLEHIVGPNADLRSPLAATTETAAGEATHGVSPVLDDLLDINVARTHADYDQVLQDLADNAVGGEKGALDRAVVADALFAETRAGVTPTLVTSDRIVVRRLAENYAVAPTTFTPAPGPVGHWDQLLAAFPDGRFTVEILTHRLIIIFRPI